MKTNAKTRKISWYTLLVTTVVVLAVLYYFWEYYLFNHYLGGFTHEGYLVQRSQTGLHFFLSVWPLWAFPLAVGIGLTLLWHQATLNQARRRIEQLEEERAMQQAARREAEVEKKPVGMDQETAPMQKILPDVNNEFEELKTAHETLQQDYQASLDFIEKLLLRLNASETPNS
ncbi:hypothetical protein Lrub_1723 [Legionella rubrilucens]|uniref:Transmembrane protein n=1 Tax=Legionella rubrilucens TaxID=458 RepID=A0A0W0XQ02_9GAMM|nr:hypothetical protein [Legionella rubrilucens]KTD46801.1 hypothetical protein Lrub_1723 [Legionella rubrilucens]